MNEGPRSRRPKLWRLVKHHPKDRAAALAITLSEGRWTHDFPITVQAARQLGIPVSANMPPIIYTLMDLYPQGTAGRPSALHVPIRRDRDSPRALGGTPPPPAPSENEPRAGADSTRTRAPT